MTKTVLFILVIGSTICVGGSLYCRNKKHKISLLITAAAQGVAVIAIKSVTHNSAFLRDNLIPIVLTTTVLTLFYFLLDRLDRRNPKDEKTKTS